MQSMTSLRILAPALLALAVAPVAFAQDSNSSATDTASGKRVSITGGYAMTESTNNLWTGDTRTEFDGEGTPTLGVTYHVNDNIGIEAWGADKVGQRMRTDAGKVGSIEAQPVAVSGQYHFGQADNIVRPFVGLGYHQTNYSDEQLASGERLGMETAKGAVGTVGVDVNINPTWFARADARYFDGTSDVKVDGAKVGEAKLNPVMVGVGIGARF